MTFHPHDPRRSHPIHRVGRDGDGVSGFAMAGVLIACGLVVGIVLYALNRDDRTASDTSLPPATSGQSQQAPTPARSDPAPKTK